MPPSHSRVREGERNSVNYSVPFRIRRASLSVILRYATMVAPLSHLVTPETAHLPSPPPANWQWRLINVPTELKSNESELYRGVNDLITIIIFTWNQIQMRNQFALRGGVLTWLAAKWWVHISPPPSLLPSHSSSPLAVLFCCCVQVTKEFSRGIIRKDKEYVFVVLVCAVIQSRTN